MYAEVGYLRYEEEQDRWYWEERRERCTRQRDLHEASHPERPTYEIIVTGRAISLDFAEFQIMRLLARRPYHAFRPEEIVRTITAEGVTDVTVDNLRQVIVDLRQKLGFFRDYIQSVPYIGYRFKP